jgi:hypothetical protein
MKTKTYNKKAFLLPDSHRSMACYHAKVMDDHIMKMTIHDCKRSVQLKNDLSHPDELAEAIEKLNNLAVGIQELIGFIEQNYQQRTETIESTHYIS